MTLPHWTADERAAGLLRCVIDAPDDDEPRKVLADRLEEIDESDRAEFVRVQVELACPCPQGCPPESVLSGGHLCPECKASGRRKTLEGLQAREREMWHWHLAAWLEETSPVLVSRTDAANPADRLYRFVSTFRRGFVESIECTWQDWLAHADAIRASTPLRAVRLTTRPAMGSSGDETEWWLQAERFGAQVGKRHRMRRMSLQSSDPQLFAMLAAEWRGITFTLRPPRRSPGNLLAPSALMCSEMYCSRDAAWLSDVMRPDVDSTTLAGLREGVPQSFAYCDEHRPAGAVRIGSPWSNAAGRSSLVGAADLDAAMEAARPFLEPLGYDRP